jgi:uncharacterized lipoprotein YmbA
MNPRSFFSATLALTLLGVSGCNVIPEAQSDPTRFYVLEDPQAASGSSDELGVTLGLLPLELPLYLDNARSLAVAAPGNQITFRDFERWAESLDDGVTRVLRSALTRAPGVARVRTAPFSLDASRDFDVLVRLVHCEGFESGDTRSVRFALTFELMSTKTDFVHLGSYAAPAKSWDGSSSHLASLLSQAIIDASLAIAQSLP